MRTIVDIPEEDILKLDALAARSRRSRAAEIRDAVGRHLAVAADAADKSWIYGEGYGYWKDRDDIGDAVEYQRAMREDRDLD